MERALAALASAAAPRENRGAHARTSPPGEWSAILACKDVQMQDDIPSSLGSVLLDTPMTDAGDLLPKAATSPGPRASAMKLGQTGKSRGTSSRGGESGPFSCAAP